MKTERGRLVPLLMLGASLCGCYIEATGGMYAVTGANNAAWRLAPGFGASVGVAYDAFVTRAAIGGGGEAVHTRIANTDNVVVAGPLVARMDLSPGRLGTRGLFRIAFGAAWGASQRFRTAPDGTGVVEGRPTQALQAFLIPSTGWVLGGGREDHYVMLDIGVGPAGIVMWDNAGLTNLYGVGGQARIAIAIPLSYNDGVAIGAGVNAWAAWSSSPEMRARVHEEFMRSWGEDLDRTQRRMNEDRERNQVSDCPSGVYHHDSNYNLECTR